MTLADILSGCYGPICSQYKYPLSSVLRQGVFSECAENVLGWAQNVLDYLTEREKSAAQNEPPEKLPAVKADAEQASAASLLRYRRVSHLDALYGIWMGEEAAYAAAASREVPSGPDAGKRLGDPQRNRTAQQKRRRMRPGGRRTTILGQGYLGKRGARRILRWLLSDAQLKVTLTELDVLIYPSLYPKERVEQARQYPHPYWLARARRRLGAIRPTHQRDQGGKRPLRLGKLSQEQRVRLRDQLREQRRFKIEFTAIEGDIRRFIDKAPPSFPYILRPIFTEEQI